jgi:hypothetical protein
MRTLLTLKYGNKYTAEDVNKIYQDTGGEYNYVCLTDDPIGLHEDIKVLPVNAEYGHWNKVLMLGLKDLGDVLYLDLDVHIQKNIVDIWNQISYIPTICYTYWKPKNFPTSRGESIPEMNYLGNFNSSVMLWQSGTCENIVNGFLKHEDYYMVKYCGGDDRFFWHEHYPMKVFSQGLIYSFVYGADYETDKENFKYRPEYNIALLNGQDQFPEAKQKYNDALSMHKMG